MQPVQSQQLVLSFPIINGYMLLKHIVQLMGIVYILMEFYMLRRQLLRFTQQVELQTS